MWRRMVESAAPDSRRTSRDRRPRSLLDVPIRFDPKGTLMRGTIQKKGKKWYAVVYDGVNPATGEYRRRWVQAGTRRGDAEKLLAELVKRAHRGEKAGRVSFWLQPADYEQDQFREAWERIGHGGV